VRRVRLIAGAVNAATLSSRQRRQIEIRSRRAKRSTWSTRPSASARQRSGRGERARQPAVQARVRRGALHGHRLAAHALQVSSEPRPNQILATVTPNGEAGSVT
jgi:hypothetical protein